MERPLSTSHQGVLLICNILNAWAEWQAGSVWECVVQVYVSPWRGEKPLPELSAKPCKRWKKGEWATYFFASLLLIPWHHRFLPLATVNVNGSFQTVCYRVSMLKQNRTTESLSSFLKTCLWKKSGTFIRLFIQNLSFGFTHPSLSSVWNVPTIVSYIEVLNFRHFCTLFLVTQCHHARLNSVSF